MMQQGEQRPGAAGQAGETQIDAREAWTTPSILQIRAGEAENGFVNAGPDNQFTTS